MAATSAPRLALRRGPLAARADGHQRADHLAGALEYAPGIIVAQRFECFVEGAPLAGGNPFVGPSDIALK